jgi:DNA-binding MarR family transcriptional regulator
MFLIKQGLDKEFKSMHVTESQSMVMRTLNHFGDMKVSDISKKLDLSNSTVSGIIDRLVERGIVERKRSEKDRRVVMISLSEDYRQPIKKHFEAISKKLGTAMTIGTKEDLDFIVEALRKLKSILEEAQKLEKGEKECSN